jgi:RNA 2',3'-cyclic 3'-phosphodiesterase
LKFLGSTNIEKITKIKKAVSLTSENFKKFYYTGGHCPDAFPSLKAARIVFVPVAQESECLEKLFSLLEDNLGKVKIRKEKRKFVSHITVARLKNIQDITEKLAAINTKYPEPLLCSHIALYESILKPAGAEYDIIEEFELQ